jgi:hypothetical protein
MDAEARLKANRDGIARYWAEMTLEQRESRRQKFAATAARKKAEKDRLYWSDKVGRTLTYDEAMAEKERWNALTRLEKAQETRARTKARQEAEYQRQLLRNARREERRRKREGLAQAKAEAIRAEMVAAADAERARWASLSRAEKSRETRAKNRVVELERRRRWAEAERKERARRERARESRLARLDSAALPKIGPAPIWTPIYIAPPGAEFPGPSERVRPAYVLRRQGFWDYVEMRSPNECWPWHGAWHPYWDGYGWATFMGSGQSAHRVAWQLHYRLIIPPRWVGDHMCEYRGCCNSLHIDCCPHGENVRRIHRRPPEAIRTRTYFGEPQRWYPHGRRRQQGQEVDLADNEESEEYEAYE